MQIVCKWHIKLILLYSVRKSPKSAYSEKRGPRHWRLLVMCDNKSIIRAMTNASLFRWQTKEKRATIRFVIYVRGASISQPQRISGSVARARTRILSCAARGNTDGERERKVPLEKLLIAAAPAAQ